MPQTSLSAPKKVLLAAVMAVISLFAVELLFRAWLSVQGTPYSAKVARAEVNLIRNRLSQGTPMPEKKGAMSHNRFLHPYTGFDEDGHETQNQREMAYFKLPKRGSEYCILLLGGSVAGLLGSGMQDVIVNELKTDPRLGDKDIRLFSQARGGFKQPQQVTQLAMYFSMGYHPDMVVNIDGFNEVALAAHNIWYGTNAHFPAATHWAFLASGRSTDPKPLLLRFRIWELQQELEDAAQSLHGRLAHSSVLGTIALRRIQGIQLRASQCFQELQDEVNASSRSSSNPAANLASSASKGPPMLGNAVEQFAEATQGWLEGSISLKGLCDARGISYVHILQPTLHDPGSKPLTPREIELGGAHPAWEKGSIAGYPILRELGTRLTKLGVHFNDLSMIFVDYEEETYFDCCHFRGEGQEMFARAVAQTILSFLQM